MGIDGRCGNGAQAVDELLKSADNSLHLFGYCASMAVTMRDRWTDERLDDLNGKVDGGFRRMDERFDKVDERFDRVDERFDRLEAKLDRRFELMDQRFDTVNQRFDTVMLSLLQGGIALAAAMLVGFVALAVAAL
jgi:predicted nuclease with TOPRIM domain